MFEYTVTVGKHTVRGFSMTRNWAKETVLLEVKTLWKEYGWQPAAWAIRWGKYNEEGGVIWRA